MLVSWFAVSTVDMDGSLFISPSFRFVGNDTETETFLPFDILQNEQSDISIEEIDDLVYFFTFIIKGNMNTGALQENFV